MKKLQLTTILKFVVQQNIKMLYLFTEYKIAYALLGVISTYAIYSSSFSSVRILCLVFTTYYGFISSTIYLVCKSTRYYPYLIELVGLEFILEYLGEETASKQFVRFAGGLIGGPLALELTTDLAGHLYLDHRVHLKDRTYENDFGSDRTKWHTDTLKDHVAEVNKLVNSHVPGGLVTKLLNGPHADKFFGVSSNIVKDAIGRGGKK